ncbi:hypothetical protein DPMN_003910 [Dreissena polymorpha]|uniref:Uncharacterized protein n=1 Tax=Dreissena polymorpha TaxID=45954 RepID=A0A9D4MP80_DREPO|nr:hypothetical protein DPMN_003910 [Dreissena polymorpha]
MIHFSRAHCRYQQVAVHVTMATMVLPASNNVQEAVPTPAMEGSVRQGDRNLYMHRGGQSVCELQDMCQWLVRRRLLLCVHKHRQ